MPINVWVAQSQAIKAEVEAINGGATAKDAIRGTRAEQRAYAAIASKITDKFEGRFRDATIKGKNLILEPLLFVDSDEEVAALEKGGAVILGAWYENGQQHPDYPPHPDLINFMPIRKTYDKDGVETGSLPPVLEDVVVKWGQGPRQFA